MTILQKIQSLIAAANTKTGESDTTLTDAVQTLIDGYGQGGGSGYAKKTGSFTLADDYTYNDGVSTPYTGMLIETGLSVVQAVIIWSEEWQAGTETNNCFGLSLGFDVGFGVVTGINDILHYYAGVSYMRNGSNNHATTAAQGLLFHSFSNSVPAGSFGIKCYSSKFPIRAGHTIRWEAWGEE